MIISSLADGKTNIFDILTRGLHAPKQKLEYYIQLIIISTDEKITSNIVIRGLFTLHPNKKKNTINNCFY